MRDLTALVLTYNEQENISRTLDSISWIGNIVVVDSYSSDETVKIARSYPNVAIVERKFDDHTNQWNFGLEQIQTGWVLSLDADYKISARLKEEIENLRPNEETSGYFAHFEYRIFGRPLRASVYPPRVVLFRRSQATYVPDGHTQMLKVDGKTCQLRSPIFHDDRKPLSRWIQSQDSYARIEADHLTKMRSTHLQPQDRLRLGIYFAPAVMFFYLLFCRGLILDGWRGWYYVCQRVIAELLLSIRIIEQQHKLERPK